MELKENLKLIQNQFRKRNIYKLISLTPLALIGFIFFGLRAILITVVCVASSVIFQYIINAYIEKTTDYDYLDAIVSGLFFGLILPSTLSLYIVVIGSAFSVFIVKLFLRSDNSFVISPALASRAFLQISFPTQMSSFLEPMSDIKAMATPLSSDIYSSNEILFGITSGCIGETSTILIVICGLYLLYTKIISWEIPVSILGTSLFFSFIFGQDPLVYMFSGGLMLVSFFLVIDETKLPQKQIGKIIFGVFCGILIAVIRYVSLSHEGISFAVVFTSLFVPFIDKININFSKGMRKI